LHRRTSKRLKRLQLQGASPPDPPPGALLPGPSLGAPPPDPVIGSRCRAAALAMYTLFGTFRRLCLRNYRVRQKLQPTVSQQIVLQCIRKVYVDLYSAFYAKRLKCTQTWITQFYLQITPCLPLLSSRRTSPPFGWYSFYRPTEGRRLSRPGWLVTYRNKVPPPGVKP